MFTSNYRREVLSLVKLWRADGIFQYKRQKQNTNAIERIQARFPHMQMKKDPLHQSKAAIESLSSKSRIYMYTHTILKSSWKGILEMFPTLQISLGATFSTSKYK